MLELRNLSCRYPGSDRTVLTDLDFSLKPGELCVLMGSNGSGKSTLARVIAGLLPASGGEILINGNKMNPGDSPESSRVGLVRQDPKDQLIAGEVDDEAAFGPENLGLPREEIAARVREALQAMGLTGMEKQETGALSVGQQQRLAIAGVLAMQPEYILFDESSSMLDPEARRNFYKLCRRLTRQNIGVLSISHHPEEALAADRLAVMDKGRISNYGKPEEVFRIRRDLHQPFTLKITEALESMGLSFTRHPSSLEELAALIASGGETE